MDTYQNLIFHNTSNRYYIKFFHTVKRCGMKLLMNYWKKIFLSEFVIIIYNIGNFLYRKFLNNKFLMKYLKDAQKMFL